MPQSCHPRQLRTSSKASLRPTFRTCDSYTSSRQGRAQTHRRAAGFGQQPINNHRHYLHSICEIHLATFYCYFGSLSPRMPTALTKHKYNKTDCWMPLDHFRPSWGGGLAAEKMERLAPYSLFFFWGGRRPPASKANRHTACRNMFQASPFTLC